jgi:16S rRNA (cytosine967-C5)-methyltransferase
MKTPPPRFRGPRHDARSLALEALLRCARHDAFVQEVLDRLLSENPLPPADRGLATQLVYGTLRRRGSLDALLRLCVSRRPDQVEPWLWDVLRLGACQLLLLDHVPAHAALNETVELTARFDRPQAKGFLNGVLRSLARLATRDEATGPAADALPLEGGRYRRLGRAVLPDPRADPVQYLTLGFALPEWLARRWSQRHDADECRRLGFWFAGPAPLTLRVNPLRTTRDALLAALTEKGAAAEAGTHPQAVRLREPAPVRSLPGYDAGLFAVQDEAAMRVASALAPQPGWQVLDLCAAPGGKATHLAELMGDAGVVMACDPDEARLKTVAELAARLGLKSVRTARVGAEPGEGVPEGPFDAALVDVPCSNTGVLGRRPEVRWRLRPSDLDHLADLQARLLGAAAERVRPGGVVVYATCSVEPEENAALVRRVVTERGGLTLEAEEEAVPGRPADGGYWARLRKEGTP